MKNSAPQPPQPPQVEHRLSFYMHQIIGVGIIMLIPVLAVLGVFGTSREKVRIASDAFGMEVQYPTKIRYKTIEPFEVSVQNVSGHARELVITIEKGYLSSFSDIQFSPSPREITDRQYVFDLGMIQPGDVRVLSGQIQAEKYGAFNGIVRAAIATSAPLEAHVLTISLP